jgi:quinolinate synthase
VRPCNLCPHMKRITLPKILESLVTMKEEVVIDPAIAASARRAVERMVQLKKPNSAAAAREKAMANG